MKRLVLFLIVAAALLAPSAALASGVVLKVQKATHLVAVTNGKTKVNLVHTAARLRVGQRVTLSSRTLRNGTLAASSIRVLGRAHTVHFRGLLLKKSGTRLVVSAGGATIAVHRGARTTSSANDTGPTPGATVDVTATVGTDDELDATTVSTTSVDTPGGKIEGTLTLGTGTVTVKSDEMNLTIKVPTGFDLTQFATGDEVLATFSQQADGSLLLTDISGDGNAQEADNNDNNDDGDNSDDNGGNGDNHGDNGGSGNSTHSAAASVHI
jgi:Cu/Ag efflux protein CusF